MLVTKHIGLPFTVLAPAEMHSFYQFAQKKIYLLPYFLLVSILWTIWMFLGMAVYLTDPLFIFLIPTWSSLLLSSYLRALWHPQILYLLYAE
jgi:hypothetical protein